MKWNKSSWSKSFSPCTSNKSTWLQKGYSVCRYRWTNVQKNCNMHQKRGQKIFFPQAWDPPSPSWNHITGIHTIPLLKRKKSEGNFCGKRNKIIKNRSRHILDQQTRITGILTGAHQRRSRIRISQPQRKFIIPRELFPGQLRTVPKWNTIHLIILYFFFKISRIYLLYFTRSRVHDDTGSHYFILLKNRAAFEIIKTKVRVILHGQLSRGMS
jgi:hypothetical protein